MRLRHILVFAPLFLTACAGAFLTAEERGALTPAGRVLQLQGEFNILLSQFEVYASQPFCTTTLIVACADREVVTEAARIATEANGAVRGAQAAVRAGAVDTTALATGARIAVARLSTYLIARGVAR